MANYINNKDFLLEIAKSKASYCSFIDKNDALYDIILASVDEIPENLETARQARAIRLAKLAFDEASKTSKVKLDEFTVDPDTILNEEIVFRIKTWEHIPMEVVRSKKDAAKLKIEEMFIDENLFEEDDMDLEEELLPPVVAVEKMKYTKVNFPPFFHYKFSSDGKLNVVGKSHWKGTLDDGKFCKDHGQMTRKLAEMFIKLADRYASRSNWRGYTYNDEMRGQALLQLSQVGLQFDESKSSNPFAFYTTVTTNSFCRILNEEKKRQNLRDDILESYNMTPSYSRQGDWGNYDD